MSLHFLTLYGPHGTRQRCPHQLPTMLRIPVSESSAYRIVPFASGPVTSKKTIWRRIHHDVASPNVIPVGMKFSALGAPFHDSTKFVLQKYGDWTPPRRSIIVTLSMGFWPIASRYIPWTLQSVLFHSDKHKEMARQCKRLVSQWPCQLSKSQTATQATSCDVRNSSESMNHVACIRNLNKIYSIHSENIW